MLLSDMLDGQSGVITSIHHEGERLHRLLEMGFFEGGAVTVVRRAPLGDPLEVRLTDYTLSLRGEDARLIEVQV